MPQSIGPEAFDVGVCPGRKALLVLVLMMTLLLFLLFVVPVLLLRYYVGAAGVREFR